LRKGSNGSRECAPDGNREAIQRASPFKRLNALPEIGVTELSYPTANLSNFKTKAKGRRIMARMDLGSLPLGNPCAQCGKPIAAPEWVEAGPHRASYLWHCWVCDYRFEAVAFFDESQQDGEALAA
jgi:hypothetical protein